MISTVERPAIADIRSRVDEKYVSFVGQCLHGGYDAIVAIESEGVAVLLPQILGESTEKYPPIIPDNLLNEATEQLRDQHVLVFDASAVSARKLERVASHVGVYAQKVTKAALLLSDECPPDLQPDIWGLRLDKRAYSWAKERIVEKTLERPFPLDGDHLIFAYHYFTDDSNVSSHDEIIRAAQLLGKSYFVSPPGATIIRLTVDGIEPVARQQDQIAMWFESVCKVRLFIDPILQSVSFVPIVFPAIPQEFKATTAICPYCDLASTLNVPSVEHKGNMTSEHCFRCTALSFSAELMEEFMTLFLTRLREIQPNLQFRLAPVPDVLRGCWTLAFAEPRGVVDAAYARMSQVARRMEQQQLELEVDQTSWRFKFPAQLSSRSESDGLPVNDDGLESWHKVLVEVGQWYRKNVSILPDDIRDGLGLPFSEICQRLAVDLDRLTISRSLDVMLDEGMLRPRTVEWTREHAGYSNSKFFVRGYTTGGEHIRTLALALAATLEKDWDWLLDIEETNSFRAIGADQS